MEIQNTICRTQQRLQLLRLRTDHGSRAPSAKAKDVPYQQGGFNQGPQNTRSEVLLDKLPEDIFHHIYSLVPLQDAARAACVSHGFLCSWRRYPNLTLSEKTLRLDGTKLSLDAEALALCGTGYRVDKLESCLVNRIDHVLKNHSGIGVDTLKLQLYPCINIGASCLDAWLQIANKSRIKELALELSVYKKTEYNFPCMLLSGELGKSIQSLRLSCCAFRPMERTLGCLSSLTCLCLRSVRINEEELARLLSSCPALEKMDIIFCNEIICLKIPSTLCHLNLLSVFECEILQAVEISAPNLSTFHYAGGPVQISPGDLHVREIHMLGLLYSDIINYARTKLTSIAPYVESLTLSSQNERVNTPMEPSKFLHLKHLDISLSGAPTFSPSYDFFSLASFLNASPVLESFILRIKQDGIRHDSVLEKSSGDQELTRQNPEWRLDCLKKVMTTGFCSSKSLIELTSYILDKTSSLKCLTLDTTRDDERGFVKIDKCFPMSRAALVEAHKTIKAIKRFIEGKVPMNVSFKVVEPCSRCQPNIS